MLGDLTEEAQNSLTGQLPRVRIQRKFGNRPTGSPGQGPSGPGGGKSQCKDPEAGTCLAGVRSSKLPAWLRQAWWESGRRFPQVPPEGP